MPHSQVVDGGLASEPVATHRDQLLQEYVQSSTPTQPGGAGAPAASPTTVIIRKDIRSFNFSDIEVSERPTATLLTELARRSRNGELLHDLSQRAVTATPQPPVTELDDIFISVKTTKNYHDTRLALIIKTWFQLARDQVGFPIDLTIQRIDLRLVGANFLAGLLGGRQLAKWGEPELQRLAEIFTWRFGNSGLRGLAHGSWLICIMSFKADSIRFSGLILFRAAHRGIYDFCFVFGELLIGHKNVFIHLGLNW